MGTAMARVHRNPRLILVRLGWVLGLGALLVASLLGGGQPATAHEAPPDTVLEITVGSIYVLHPEAAHGERPRHPGLGPEGEFEVHFRIDDSETACPTDPREGRGVLGYLGFRFSARSDTWTTFSRTVPVKLNSGHRLCIASWGRELDALTRDDTMPLRTHSFSAADGWGVGGQRLDALDVRGINKQAYILDYAIRNVTSPVAAPPAVRAGVLSLPDLQVDRLRLARRADGDRACEADSRNWAFVRVHNAGTAPAGPFVVQVQTNGGTFDLRVDGLAAGAERELSLETGVAGRGTNVSAVADSGRAIAESHEHNNTASAWFSCG